MKNSSNNENIVKSTAFWLLVWKKWWLEKGIAKEIENYEPTQLNTLLQRSNAEIKNKTWLNLENDYSISSKVIRTHTEQFLELFSQTLNFFATWRCEDIITYYCFNRTLLFWPNAGLNKLFLHLMRALCLCLILISHLVFFHVYY